MAEGRQPSCKRLEEEHQGYIMDALAITRSLYKKLDTVKETLTTLLPTAISTTVAATMRNPRTVQLSVAPPAGDYGFAVLVVGTADSVPARYVIAGIHGSVVTIFTGLDADYLLTAGTAVTIEAGPLADTELYYLSPPSIENAITAGVKSYAIVNYAGQSLTTAGIQGTSRNQGSQNQKREHQVMLEAEVLFSEETATSGTAVQQHDKKIFHMLLQEQLIAIVHEFRMNNALGRYGVGDITSTPVFLDREGPGILTLGWIINFIVEMKK